MTYEEMKYNIENMFDDRLICHYTFNEQEDCKDCDMECDEHKTYMKALELLEKEEKYKWHDLRKNPNDLPQENCLCLIKEEYYSYKKGRIVEGYEILNFFTCFGQFVCTGEKQKTLAWKYVEPFEDE